MTLIYGLVLVPLHSKQHIYINMWNTFKINFSVNADPCLEGRLKQIINNFKFLILIIYLFCEFRELKMWDNKFCFKILHLSLIVCIFLGTVWGDKKVEVVKAISNEKADLFPNIQEPSCNLSQRLRDEIRSYQPIADRIIEVVLNGEYRGRSFEELAKFVDKYPHRPTGTQNLERSIDYMIEKANKDGLHNVTTQEVPVTQWIRLR